MKLFNFAYCKDFRNKIDYLATICVEDWGKPNEYTTHPILHNYIKHTFSKLYYDYENTPQEERSKIFAVQEDKYFIFNTGLYDEHWQKVYAYFTPNRYFNQQWYFEAFITEYALRNLGINEFPQRANYFSDMKELIFDINYDLILQYDHIFGDENNNQRIPEAIRNHFNKQALFDGAILNTKKRIDANYKLALPQYYDNKIQLLLPLYLTNPSTPDLALVVTRDDANKCYLGHTCLPIIWAYNNARLIAKPDSEWLVP